MTWPEPSKKLERVLGQDSFFLDSAALGFTTKTSLSSVRYCNVFPSSLPLNLDSLAGSCLGRMRVGWEFLTLNINST